MKLIAWYDNEYGFTCNMMRLLAYIAEVNPTDLQNAPDRKIRSVLYVIGARPQTSNSSMRSIMPRISA